MVGLVHTMAGFTWHLAGLPNPKTRQNVQISSLASQSRVKSGSANDRRIQGNTFESVLIQTEEPIEPNHA